jgi:hypothetical protein
MGDLDLVETGATSAIPMLEEVALDDFHGLVDLLLLATVAVDRDWGLHERLDKVYAEGRHLLG